ncbi:DNA primase family protein [Salinicoccus roseus]|uniref:DNA primase family protein n=1 Tax=Salinicoccus roseus TaxID=45670 RepID=UPI003D9FD721
MKQIDIEKANLEHSTRKKKNIVSIEEKREIKGKIKQGSWWYVSEDSGKTAFVHSTMAEYIIQEYDLVRFPDADGDLYIYNKQSGIYEKDESTRKLRAIIRNLESTLKNNSVREVRDYIVDMCRVEYQKNKEYIVANNGLVNIKDKSFKPFTPDIFVTDKIPTNYKPDAYDEFIHQTITKASCHHQATIENIKETFAMVLYPRLIVHKIIYLLGISANNGKSTILNAIRASLDGGGQISAVTPKRLAENSFAGSSMYGKMANIVDDLPDEVITDTGNIKTAVTGGWMEIEEKRQSSRSVQIQTPFIIASNHTPKFKEHGEQINKRLHILPFEYNFRADGEHMNEKETLEKIQSDSAKEYVLKLAVDTLADMLHRPGDAVLTPNERAEEAIKTFDDSSNPLSAYFEERGEEHFLNTPFNQLYQDYQRWAQLNLESHPVDRENFKTIISNQYNLMWKRQVRYKINGEWKNRPGFVKN